MSYKIYLYQNILAPPKKKKKSEKKTPKQYV